MSLKEMAYRIEEIQLNAEKADSLHKVLYDAIFQPKDSSLEDCEWAFILLGNLTYETKNELTELRDTVFGELKNEAV